MRYIHLSLLPSDVASAGLKKKPHDDLFMLCWKILFSLAPIYKVLVSRRVSIPVKENSAQHLLLSHVY